MVTSLLSDFSMVRISAGSPLIDALLEALRTSKHENTHRMIESALFQDECHAQAPGYSCLDQVHLILPGDQIAALWLFQMTHDDLWNVGSGNYEAEEAREHVGATTTTS
jgi:hypothetical protein